MKSLSLSKLNKAMNNIIKPLIGVNNILLGSSKELIYNLLGQPDTTKSDEWPDGTISESWIYTSTGLTLNFDSDDHYKLSTINSSSKETELDNLKIIGIDINKLIKVHPTIILDEDLTSGVKDYLYPEKEISFWTVNNIIEHITLFPEYDKSTNLPIWPVTE